ncbi:MAG: hypothetical protein H0W62_01545 [Chitinophagales bacterium]|nr:hypothetical protein [Chitinophagales bacterium]
MKHFFILGTIAIIFSSTADLSFAQTNSLNVQMRQYEDSLRILSDSLIDGKTAEKRLHAGFDFIKMLVQSLNQSESFQYSFDSLKRISILYPDDRHFRIFCWALPLTERTYRYYGVIQMNDKNKTVLFPFFDYSEHIQQPSDTITSAQKWYGALYYKMVKVKSGSKTYYTLFGWNQNTLKSKKKLIEILWFDENGSPQFGAPVFQFSKNEYPAVAKRFIIEYKNDAKVSLNYDEDHHIIIFDHLVPENHGEEGIHEKYVPDGSYEGFEWKNGKWRYVENVFTATQQQVPYPKPLDFEEPKKDKF